MNVEILIEEENKKLGKNSKPYFPPFNEQNEIEFRERRKKYIERERIRLYKMIEKSKNMCMG